MNGVRRIPLDQIKPNSWNPNMMDEETFNALVEDMRENGLEAIDPVILRPIGSNQYEIIDGEHRWKSAKEAGWKEIRALIFEVNEEAAKSINYRKNRERGKLDPIKEAKLFKSEVDNGLTQEEVSKKYGITQSHVATRLGLIRSGAEEIITRVIKDHELSSSHAEELSRLPSDKIEEVAKIAKNLNVQETRELVNMVKQGTSLDEATKTIQGTDALGKGNTPALERKVSDLVENLQIPSERQVLIGPADTQVEIENEPTRVFTVKCCYCGLPSELRIFEKDSSLLRLEYVKKEV